MPHSEVKPTYQVTFTANEFRLVTMALAGIIKDGQDKADALQLNVHLCDHRAHMLGDLTECAEKALEQAIKLQGVTNG